MSEEMFVRLNEAFAQERIIDSLLFPGYLKVLDGQIIRPTSGLSSRAAMLYGQWSREAVRRAGRPGSEQYARAFAALALCAVTSGSNVTGPRPTAEHRELYERLRVELVGLGVPLE